MYAAVVLSENNGWINRQEIADNLPHFPKVIQGDKAKYEENLNLRSLAPDFYVPVFKGMSPNSPRQDPFLRALLKDYTNGHEFSITNDQRTMEILG